MEHPENSKEYKGLTVNSGVEQPAIINPYLKRSRFKRRVFSIAEMVEGIVKGDVTKDGKVDISDIFEMNKMRLGYKTGDAIQRLAGDVVESDKVDMDDIFQVNKYRLKMINSL